MTDTLDAIAREMRAEAASVQAVRVNHIERAKQVNAAVALLNAWADRITALSNQGEGAAYERAYQQGYRAALGAASSECRRIGEALDHAGNTYVRYEDAIKCAVSVSGLRVPSIAIPAEADRRDADHAD